ncbi:amidohydrolase [Ferrimonas marina]|uniref:Hippurate hydrolase n=1 Tax=Ferrimonas marina TaxID=299255 RepID=A0A1M5P3M4_9GAMM|nr:amidohydrolase [Ferrimonas marina]SHG96426.1 hippurate hydrolase [Ferrimonas marina]
MTLPLRKTIAALAIGLSAQLSAASLTESVQADTERLTGIFEHIHAHPEVGFAEVETAALVARELRAQGFEVHEGIGRTGVAAVLRNGEGPTVMFRADMDALPVKEETDLPYAAVTPTRNLFGQEIYAMHACGHDAHTTWLIGMAKQLAERKDQWQGTVVLIAQPAEELIMGATAMVKDGLFDKVPKPDVLIAGHTHAVLPAGSVAISEGRRMAGTDQLDVTLKGVGGHGSTPHGAIDPVVMSAMAIMGYQTIVSRTLDQAQPAVLTVGAINAGTGNNIIPDEAVLKLNLRWYRNAEREMMIEGIKRVTDNIAQMYGVPEDRMPTYEMKGYSTPVINPLEQTEIARQAMVNALGEDKVMQGFPPVMGSEDFHMLTFPYPEVPVVFVEVGSGTAQGWDNFVNDGILPRYLNHHPKFMVQPEAIPSGTVALTSVVLEFLEQK